MQPLTLVNTSVLITVSDMNIASSSAGAATEFTVNLNSRSSRYQARMMAAALSRMKHQRDFSGSISAIGAISNVPPGGYR
ncbi:Uncharacterised protein [Mycobacteroides abscessus subsp. abscessus]|nr:Uncharacterised protein [Mycobacteroides abscessus subsp. abscessus]